MGWSQSSQTRALAIFCRGGARRLRKRGDFILKRLKRLGAFPRPGAGGLPARNGCGGCIPGRCCGKAWRRRRGAFRSGGMKHPMPRCPQGPDCPSMDCAASPWLCIRNGRSKTGWPETPRRGWPSSSAFWTHRPTAMPTNRRSCWTPSMPCGTTPGRRLRGNGPLRTACAMRIFFSFPFFPTHPDRMKSGGGLPNGCSTKRESGRPLPRNSKSGWQPSLCNPLRDRFPKGVTRRKLRWWFESVQASKAHGPVL